MPVHLSARLAWHADGWNGHVCTAPRANVYCVGPRSYPGQLIAEDRDLAFEEAHAGRPCSKLDRMLPCAYSANAFGLEPLQAYADPPDFFRDSTQRRIWSVPPATVCTWPYEAMYDDALARDDGGWDNDARREAARAYFAELEEDRSLVFYYANYSNPFSTDERPRYVLVGVSRLRKVGEELFYEGCSESVRQRYGGGFVWDRNITSHYPDQGFRLPYHRYGDRPDVLERIVLFPDNVRPFKYGTRHVSDDEALDLVERLLDVAKFLRDLGDDSESWPVRVAWLESLVAELWNSRGVFPGLARTMDALGFPEAVSWVKKEAQAGRERKATEAIFAFLDGGAKPAGLAIVAADASKVQRRWQLLEDDARQVARDILPRFDLDAETIRLILSEKRGEHGLEGVKLSAIVENPYILSEHYVGKSTDEVITFNAIDHGMLPSPDLGEPALADPDDARRFRALCVDRLTRDQRNTFTSGPELIADVNRVAESHPGWKRHTFTERYFDVDAKLLSDALVFKPVDGTPHVYLRERHEDERLIEQVVRDLASQPDIPVRVPMGPDVWRDFLYDARSNLAKLATAEYDEVIRGQAEACGRVFNRSLAVLSGGAGTGKTTVVKALVRAIERVHGAGTTFCLLAPTGKAAERLRETTGKPASTIHSFLAQRGWLNENLTLKRRGGKREGSIATVIIDETSMLNLDVAAGLMRAFDWKNVQRLIFVGDVSQLPPIGVGRMYADLVDWLERRRDPGLAVLAGNVRQLLNRTTGQGTGILDLASLYLRRAPASDFDPEREDREHDILHRVQAGGDVDKDLRVVFWRDGQDLASKVETELLAGLRADVGDAAVDAGELWLSRVGREGGKRVTDATQVIAPYRGEENGTELLNTVLQRLVNGAMLDRVGSLGGVTFQDKVIQIRNRPPSRPYWAYNITTKKTEKVPVYNGEMGFAEPHLYDCQRSKWKWDGFRMERFQVVFARRPDVRIEFKSAKSVEDNIDLAYAISVHKAQGSDFDRVYFVVPKNRRALLSKELLYTGLTRARRHCTLLIEEDIEPLVAMRRPESSHLLAIATSLLEFRPIPEALRSKREWYEEGKIHRSLADVMVRSKSELIIANLLFERDIDFRYEKLLYAPDGTFQLPDFTIRRRGEEWFWEHLGMLDKPKYRERWERKRAWYDRHFPGRLVTTTESPNLSQAADAIIREHFT